MTDPFKTLYSIKVSSEICWIANKFVADRCPRTQFIAILRPTTERKACTHQTQCSYLRMHFHKFSTRSLGLNLLFALSLSLCLFQFFHCVRAVLFSSGVLQVVDHFSLIPKNIDESDSYCFVSLDENKIQWNIHFWMKWNSNSF